MESHRIKNIDLIKMNFYFYFILKIEKTFEEMNEESYSKNTFLKKKLKRKMLKKTKKHFFQIKL